ncbi:MAG: hypothetical protein LLF92_03835 [Planctomycetaceae bacterium]|nr:hypothetical protein [Planctomycetaceae bacterium]
MKNMFFQKNVIIAIMAIMAVTTVVSLAGDTMFFEDWRSEGDDWYWDCTTAWYDIYTTPWFRIPIPGNDDNIYIDDNRTCIFRTNDDLGNPVASPLVRITYLGDYESGGHLSLQAGEYTYTSTLGIYETEMETSITQYGGGVIGRISVGMKHDRSSPNHHDANSTYNLYAGQVTANPIVIAASSPGTGLKCKGTFNIYDGYVKTKELSLAKADCNAVVNMTGGTLEIYDVTGGTLQVDIKVGWAGAKEATFNFGNEESTGLITSLAGQNANIWLLKDIGIFNGWGQVTLANRIFNDGIIQANGYGTERDLDMSAMALVRNVNDNLVGKTNGWYAMNKGRLILPPVAVAVGTNSYNWGEDAADTDIDLINSARLTLNAAAAGTLSGSLLDNDRSDIPGALRATGVWDFAGPALTGSVGIVIRYDEFLAADLGITEANLKLYHYENNQWVNVTGSVDTAKKQISGTAGSLGLFSVGIPIDTPINCSEVHKIGQGYPGDLDENCVVNLDDLAIFTDQWLMSDPFDPIASDLNSDKTVNMKDLGIIANDWLKDNNP